MELKYDNPASKYLCRICQGFLKAGMFLLPWEDSGSSQRRRFLCTASGSNKRKGLREGPHRYRSER